MGIFKRKIKNTFDIARETGIDEEKIKELKNGERHIEGQTMEKVLTAINRSKVDRQLEKSEIFDWYMKTDLKALRKKFGYAACLHLAKEINMDCSTLNRIENKKFDKLKNSIIKVYDFYHNDFNKKVDKEPVIVEDKTSDENKIYNWYLNTDIAKLRKKTSMRKQAKKIGISQSCLYEIENHKRNGISGNMIKIYNYYNNDNLCSEKIKPAKKYNKKVIYSWYKSIKDLKEYRRKFGYSLNKMIAIMNISYDQMRDFETHKYKSATPVVCKFYEFYNNEENRLPEIKLENYSKPKTESNVKIEEDKVAVIPFEYIKKVFENDETEDLKKQIEEKDKRIAELERQIMIYEKLIERL